ncbi:MAG: cohesin domain-containing protein, partial [Bacillota bacterium]|nr:cohesin domain-containing protein [Bacillota bacterium]
MMNLFKKRKMLLVSMIICMSFLLLFSQSAFAADGVKLSASTESGITGDTVTVTINISDALDLEGGQFDLAFDSDVLEPKSAARGDFVPDVSGNVFDYNLDLEDGKIRVLWVIAAGSEKDSGVVGTIVFDLLDDGETDLTFSNVTMAPDDVEVDTPTSGKVTVISIEAARQAAIDDADEAIADLPDCEDITLDDKADVEAARELVEYAMDEYDVEENDFEDYDKLECAEAMIEQLEAIKAACDAVNALPSVSNLTLDDKADVVAARALVNKAKADYELTDADFACLTTLVAAENRIKELEGLKPTPPTGGGMPFVMIAGGAIALTGVVG